MKSIKRRKLQGKTDYSRRLKLLKSEKPRLVVRKTNKYIIIQFVESDIAKDKTITGISSKALLAKSWPEELSGSLKNKAAAYLTGLLIGKIAKGKINEAILDIGLHRNVKKSRIYSALKGVLDAGINISHSTEVLPSVEEIKKGKTSDIFNKVKEEIEK